MTRRGWDSAAGALLTVVLLTGCTGADPEATPPVSSSAPSAPSAAVTLPAADPGLSEAGRAACAALMAALPDTLAGQDRAVPAAADTAAWGDPAIRVRCGVGVPAGFDPTAVPGDNDPAPCAKVSGVGWYVAPDQLDGKGDAVLTAVTFAPRVAVLVPQTYLPEGSAAALAELADPVRRTLSRSLRCG